jgi:hypothetical protein
MTPPALEVTRDPGTVWRVGFAPDPWEWSDWKYAQDDGRFGGRWDDQLSQFRTIYTAESLYACLVELLAKLRPCREIDEIVMAIEDPDGQALVYPEYAAGTVNFSWFSRRQAGKAILSGRFCYVTHSNSLAALRRHFSPANYGLVGVDFDAALLKDSEVRVLTRSIARWLYEQDDPDTGIPLVDGIEFRSRYGDDLKAWAIFERADEGTVSTRFTNIEIEELTPDTPELLDALLLHDLKLV